MPGSLTIVGDVWTFEFDWTITADVPAKSCTMRASGTMIGTNVGSPVAMDGVITGGWHAGAAMHMQGSSSTRARSRSPARSREPGNIGSQDGWNGPLPMPRYLLELYLSASASFPQAAEEARRVASDTRDGAMPVRYLRTLFVAEGETCFHVFDAPSREALIDAASHAGFVAARLTEAIEDSKPGDAVESARP